MDLRLGDYREVLRDVTCDLLCVDAPYSAKTHAGHNAGTRIADNASSTYSPKNGTGSVKRSKIDYVCWTAADVAEFCEFWSGRCTRWIVSVTDHVLAPIWAGELERLGRYVFAPIPYINAASGCRYSGDGPSNWTCWIVVARPRTRKAMQWRTLPGAYAIPLGFNDRNNGQALVTGGKSEWLMRSLVRDYSRPGDLVCDPCAGGGTTLLAAAQTGRRAVGAELDPVTHAKALKRLANTPVTTDLVDVLQAQQMGLL